MIRTQTAVFDALATRVHTLHSYEVPEVIALPILAGVQVYLNLDSARDAERRLTEFFVALPFSRPIVFFNHNRVYPSLGKGPGLLLGLSPFCKWT